MGWRSRNGKDGLELDTGAQQLIVAPKAFREPTLMFTRNEQAVSGRVVGGYQRAACPARPSAGELVLPRAPPGGPAQKALPSEPVACVPGSAVAFVLRGRASS